MDPCRPLLRSTSSPTIRRLSPQSVKLTQDSDFLSATPPFSTLHSFQAIGRPPSQVTGQGQRMLSRTQDSEDGSQIKIVNLPRGSYNDLGTFGLPVGENAKTPQTPTPSASAISGTSSERPSLHHSPEEASMRMVGAVADSRSDQIGSSRYGYSPRSA